MWSVPKCYGCAVGLTLSRSLRSCESRLRLRLLLEFVCDCLSGDFIWIRSLNLVQEPVSKLYTEFLNISTRKYSLSSQ